MKGSVTAQGPRERYLRRSLVMLSACIAVLALSAAPAQAAIFFRSASSVTPTSASSITLNAPSGTSVGDFMFLDIDTNGGSTSFSRPTGWTSVFAGTNYSGGFLGGGYTVIAYSKSDNEFTITKDGTTGVSTRTCTTSNKAGCPNSGSW